MWAPVFCSVFFSQCQDVQYSNTLLYMHTQAYCAIRHQQHEITHAHTHQMACHMSCLRVKAWLCRWWELIPWLSGFTYSLVNRCMRVCLWVNHQNTACVWLHLLLLISKCALVSGALKMHCRWRDRLYIEASKQVRSKQLAVTQACNKNLSCMEDSEAPPTWVIIDDGNQTPEESCHGHRHAGTSQNFDTIVVDGRKVQS